MPDAKVSLKFEGDDEALNRTLLRLENRLESVTKKLGKLGASGKRAGKGVGDEFDKTKKKVSNAFGPDAIGQVRRYAVALGGIVGSVAAIRRVFGELARERDEALQRVITAAPTRGALAQVSGGDPFKFRIIQAEAAKSRTEFGLEQAEADRLQFALQSAGLGVQFDDSVRARRAGRRVTSLGERELFAGLKNVTDPEGVVEGVQKLLANFPGERRKPSQILSQLFAASKVSPALIGQFGSAVAKPSQGVQLIGGTSSEALGAIAILAKAADSMEVGSTQIARLADIIAKKGAGGNQGLVAGVLALEATAKDLTPAELIEFIPEVRARKGFLGFLTNFQKIIETIEDVEKAGTALTKRQRRRGRMNETERIVETVRGDEPIDIVRRLNIAQQRRKLAEEEKFAGFQARTDIAIAQVGTQAVEDPAAGRLTRNFMAGLMRFFGASEGAILAADFMVTGRGDLIGERIDTHRKLEQAAIQLNLATQHLNGGPTLARPDVDK